MESNILVMSKELKDMTAILGELQEKMKGVNEAFSEFSVFKDSTAVIRENIKAIGEELGHLKAPSILEKVDSTIGIVSLLIQIKESRKSIENEIEKIANVFKNNTKIQEAVNKLGKDIANGISEGLKDGINVVKMSTTVICNDGVLETIKDELQIKSPSKVMKRIGEYISEGLGDGIKDGGKHIKAAMGDATDIIEDSSKRMSKLQFGLGGLTAVTAIVVPLIDYFVNMMSTNETLSAKMEEIWVKSCIYIITLMVV